jgi:hypothetical protein
MKTDKYNHNVDHNSPAVYDTKIDVKRALTDPVVKKAVEDFDKRERQRKEGTLKPSK